MRISLILAILSILFSASAAMAIEEPKYTVLEKSTPFELREYVPLILAEVEVAGDMDDASSQGFRLIAAYIFGKNQAKNKMNMTAPVTIESKDTNLSQRIAMTAPVTIQESKQTKPNEPASNKNLWIVSFVMPSEYTLADLPQPLDDRVHIRELPAEKKAAITFSGRYSEEKVLEKTQELQAWMKTRQLKEASDPQFARYNPPWTLPFFRRNEVLIRVSD
ncbi:SOUL family heme-binding protein [Polynucleobacter meluiroseus]|uniref:SOUL family heme-binding protein n=1 Tax=Polynucleobacter meluiroseus TaxID=1938814 RepID=UPI001FAFF468|nr:heme-binding protein [Polynucleobacter meluiroseus]